MNGRNVAIIVAILLAVLVGGTIVFFSEQNKAPVAMPTPIITPTATAVPTVTITQSPVPSLPQSPTPTQTTAPRTATPRSGTTTITAVSVLELTSPTQIKGRYQNEDLLFRSDESTRFAATNSSGVIIVGNAKNFSEAGIKAGDILQLQVNWDNRSPEGVYLVVLAAKR